MKDYLLIIKHNGICIGHICCKSDVDVVAELHKFKEEHNWKSIINTWIGATKKKEILEEFMKYLVKEHSVRIVTTNKVEIEINDE